MRQRFKHGFRPDCTRPIALFIPSLNGGGAERVIVTLANSFATRGCKVDLVAASAVGPFLADVLPLVRVVDLKVKRVSRALLPLRNYLCQERPVALLSAQTHANIIAILARELTNMDTRLVISERTTISAAHRRTAGLAGRITFGLVPSLYPRADGICAVSHAASEDLASFARLESSRVRTIYNPFDIERIDRLADATPEDPWLAPGERPVLLGVGRLAEEKDFGTLMRAFAKVRARHPLRLLILGEGELRSELEALAATLQLTDDDLRMPGFVANPYMYFRRCAAFALTSRWEGLPGVLIEALACGARVISTDCASGPREILQDGRWGALVPVGDENALAVAIAAALDAPASVIPDGRLRALEFGHERSIDEYLEILGLGSSKSRA